jgi:hypothetical protein
MRGSGCILARDLLDHPGDVGVMVFFICAINGAGVEVLKISARQEFEVGNNDSMYSIRSKNSLYLLKKSWDVVAIDVLQHMGVVHRVDSMGCCRNAVSEIVDYDLA